MIAERRLGILGGTFDPFHNGHLDAADAAQRALALNEIVFVPSAMPPHRTTGPRATAFHRFALVALAIAGRDGYRASDIELARSGPSFTADTLRAVQGEGWDASQIFFVIGSDAFADIAAWREYPRLLDAANFVVIARPGTPLAAVVAGAPELASRVRSTDHAPEDRHRTAIFLVDAPTRDVSSSTIRSRLASGQPIADLVPTPVARHIEAHRLYGTEDKLHG